MITRERLVDVLRSHTHKRGTRDMHTHCLCGWVSDRANGPGQHVEHQAEAVVEALVIEAAYRANGLAVLPYEELLDEEERHDR